MRLQHRVATAADCGFRRLVFDESRAPQFAGLEPAQREQLLAMQFRARERAYAEQFPDLETRVLLLDGQPFGVMSLFETPQAIRIVDIAMLGAWRGKGLGESALREVLASAAARGVGVVLSVEPDNPAARLYSRLGFRKTGADDGWRLEMRWDPPDAP